MLKSARHVLLSLAAFVVASPVVAQSPQSRIGDPAIEAVTSQLRDLTHLAADEWRYHAGDLPHGEDAGLDDSRWTVVKSRSQAPESSRVVSQMDCGSTYAERVRPHRYKALVQVFRLR